MTAPGQYSADCQDTLSRFVGAKTDKLDPIRQSLADLNRNLSIAVKFALPDGGRLLDETGSHQPATIRRLPYPTVALEFDYPGYSSKGPGYIVVASETTEAGFQGIKLNVLYQEKGVWIPLRGDLCRSQTTTAVRAWEPVLGWEAPSLEVVRDFTAGVEAVLEAFLAVLECSNVKAERIPADAFQNSKRVNRGRTPLGDYWVLTIPGRETPRGVPSNSPHASPRQHLRRGHIRHLGNGRPIWINACVVGRGPGVVEKDYRVAL